MNWRDYSYLRHGSDVQQQAYEVLNELSIFATFRRFDPALVSTVCIGLDTPASDLDVICELEPAFISVVHDMYGGEDNFRMQRRSSDEVVARFDTPSFPVEIFAKEQPVHEQYAWRHLSTMHRLLTAAPELRDPVRDLKRQGYGTEEAFAELLDLKGDPYQALLRLENLPRHRLEARCRRAV